MKNIGFEEEENSNGGMKENDDIVINKKMLKNKDFVNSAISNTPFNQNIINISDEEKEVKDKNNDKNGDSEEKKNNIINENQELVLDVLVSLKKITDANGCCAPGNFEENDDTFFGIIPFTITMIEEILKDQKIIEDYGKRLKEIVSRLEGKMQPLDIIKKCNITKPEIIKLSNEIADLEEKYKNLKIDYKKKYGEENDILEKDLKIFIERNKIQKEIKKVITKIESSKNLVLNDELINMQRVMRRLDFVTKDEILTTKGHIICDISGADELLTAELLFNGFFKDLTLEEIGAALYCCLSKENNNKKDDEISLNQDKMAKKNIEKIFIGIKKKAEHIADILEECKILDKNSKKRYIDGFNDIYMLPMYKWINGYSFSDLIKEYYTLYEGSLIRVIRRVEEFSKSFIISAQNIGDNNLQSKLEEMESKIKRGLPFTASLYLEEYK